ncbi:Zn(II)2Cys6 transcription factor domain-containing protein [Aspergillus foveolatus]|uniref:Zn(II)2Cys6 transcription factor domain-containing protein n=1 Tax=Aspergillus foveolatus TaxID=210207 RepID=UPI003CCD2BB5
MARRAHTKSRTGCRTCKTRRIRCDETWPSCKRCTSTGRRCDGPSSTPARPVTVSFAETYTLESLGKMRPFQKLWDTSGEETRYVQFFIWSISQGEPRPHNLSPVSDWRPLMIRAMHREPAMRQCVVALSALIQERVAHSSPGVHGFDTPPRSNGYVFALEKYGKALLSLQELLENSNSDVAAVEAALLCGIVCIWFEILMRDFLAGLSHLERCLRIVLRPSSYSEGNINPEIRRAYMKMDMQATLYIGMRAPAASISRPPPIPYIFETLHDAETSLMHEHAQILHFGRRPAKRYRYHEPGHIPLELIARTRTFQHRLAVWKSAFTYSYSCQKALGSSPRVSAAASLLLIQYYVACIMASTCLYAEETLYDQFLAQFRRIIDLAKACTEHFETAFCTRSSSIGVPVSMGVIYPLYFVATKCRDSRVRQEAIEVLSSIPYPDGVWEGRILEVIAQRAKVVEELGLNADQLVPEFKRIHVLGLAVHPESRKVCVEFRRRPNGMDGEWEEWEEWISY